MKDNIYDRPNLVLITLAVDDVITASTLIDGNDWTETWEASTGFDEWGQ